MQRVHSPGKARDNLIISHLSSWPMEHVHNMHNPNEAIYYLVIVFHLLFSLINLKQNHNLTNKYNIDPNEENGMNNGI